MAMIRRNDFSGKITALYNFLKILSKKTYNLLLLLYSISVKQILYERDDCMSRLLYSRYPVLNKLFWFFQHYFKDATIPTMENLFLVVVSILVLDTFHSVRYAWMHVISKLSGKSLNSFYHTLEQAPFKHREWGAVTAEYARHTVPDSLKDSAVFLSIDDTMVEKYGKKFEARSKLFDHAAHNGSNYLNGHCFVSVMLHVPVSSPSGIIYLSVPLGYRLWTKQESKLELAAQMVRSVMPVLSSCKQVILLCDSWYPKKPVTGLVAEFENLEMICSVRIDTVLYDLPGAPTGKRGRPRIHGERIAPGSIPLEKPEELDYYTGCREVMTNLWKGKHVHAYVTASDPDDRNSYRLFLSTVPADGIHINAREHADRKIRQYNECGMLPMGVFSIRWNIETGYYETKTFWSFNNYMVRSAEGIERLTNLICISYAACKLLPYYSRDFEGYKGLSTQEVRYQLGERIRRSIIIRSLEQMTETLKNNIPIKKAFQKLIYRCG